MLNTFSSSVSGYPLINNVNYVILKDCQLFFAEPILSYNRKIISSYHTKPCSNSSGSHPNLKPIAQNSVLNREQQQQHRINAFVSSSNFC